MTIRELKISELNHILPLVRMTLEKEEELKTLREQANKLKHKISNFKSLQKDNIHWCPDISDKTTLSSHLKQYIDGLNFCKQQIKRTEDYITTYNLLFEGFAQMFNYGLLNCYQNGGILKVSELNEDYIYEYAYLIKHTSLTVYTLLSMRPEVLKKVESIIKTELTSRKKIREYLNLVIKFDKLL